MEAALIGNPRLVFHAILNDPLTAAALSLAEIARMVKKVSEQNRAYLARFKHFRV